ncbi:hypothetical protein B0H13DRAFT_1961174 [Mycena leptocephala]|nr:hypothetical protein B0H13DRAFT_1961174 [Mycena leptocephala]
MQPPPHAIYPRFSRQLHDSLLAQLSESQLDVLSFSDFGRDFVARRHRYSDGREDVSYVLPTGLALFEPVLIGHINTCTGADAAHMELVLPPHAEHRMVEFFSNQFECLKSIISFHEQNTPHAFTLEDVIPWCAGPLRPTSGGPSERIMVVIASDSIICRNTSNRIFFGCEPPQAKAPSSVLCGGTPSHRRPLPSDGDLVAIQCHLQARDFSRPPTAGRRTFIRVYTIIALRVEILCTLSPSQT